MDYEEITPLKIPRKIKRLIEDELQFYMNCAGVNEELLGAMEDVKKFTLTQTQFVTLNYIMGNLQDISMCLDRFETPNIPKLQESIKTDLKDELEPIVMALREQLYERKEKGK